MRTRLFYLSLTIVVAVMAVVLLSAAIGSAAPATDPAADVATADARTANAELRARRAISIPYGIATTQEITADGSQLSLTGHGVCWEEGQMFDLRVRVAQSSTHAFAEGRSVDICMGGERQTWTTVAEIGGQAAFEPGPARACAEAVEFAKHGVADEYMWCKDVELTQADDEGY